MKKFILSGIAFIMITAVHSQPPGTIMAYAGTKENVTRLEARGWVVCDGKLYSRNLDKYKNLFNAIGTS